MSGKFKIVLGWLAVILISDQASKLIVDRTMPLHHSIPVIDDLFNLNLYPQYSLAAFRQLFAGSAEGLSRRPFFDRGFNRRRRDLLSLLLRRFARSEQRDILPH